MAFQTNRSQSNGSSTNSFVKKADVSVTTEKKKSENINISGMYDGKEGSKLVAKGGALKETITIPAGFSIKLFQKGGVSKNGKKLPTYELVAQSPRVQD